MQSADDPDRRRPHLPSGEAREARLAAVYVPDDVPLSGSGGGSDEGGGDPYPKEYEGRLDYVMIDHRSITERTKKLAELIHEDYKDERPLFLCVLKGASVFFHQLLAELRSHSQCYSYEFLQASSYDGADTTGTVTLSSHLDYTILRDRHVIVVEDIVDTGTTIAKLIPVLEREGRPRSVEVCTLLEKRLPDRRRGPDAAGGGGGGGGAKGGDGERHMTEVAAKFAVRVRYCGFSIPNKFIVGFGLDYDELYRDLNDVWVMSKEGIEMGGKI